MHREDMQGNTRLAFGSHKRDGLGGKKGCAGKKKKKLEGAAVFGWCMGAAVREDRSPRGAEAGEGVCGVQEQRGHAAELGHAGCLSRQGRAGMHGAEHYRGSRLSSTYRTPEQQSWEGRRGQQHGAGCAAARSGSRQCSTGMSRRYGVERDGSCSVGRELTTAASGKGWRELPVGQKLQQAWGKAVPLQHRLHRDGGVTQGKKRSIPGAGGGGGCGASGREKVWGQGASKYSCSTKTGPARCPGIYLAEKSKPVAQASAG